MFIFGTSYHFPFFFNDCVSYKELDCCMCMTKQIFCTKRSTSPFLKKNYTCIGTVTYMYRSLYFAFRIRPCGTIFSNVNFSRYRLSASNVKFPQMYLRDLVFDSVKRLLWCVFISNSAEKATSTGKVLS